MKPAVVPRLAPTHLKMVRGVKGVKRKEGVYVFIRGGSKLSKEAGAIFGFLADVSGTELN